ncbi:MAG TPA: 2OG-Fe(II) oxygenase [Sphingomicrobium sp.]|nr:2OG-Fe(II) oxygenase [Sphingomicrobium sp.]
MIAGAPWPIPPHAQLRDFLPREQLEALLDWTLSSRSRFRDATVKPHGGAGNRVDPSLRVALTLSDLGSLRPALERRMLEVLPDLMRACGSHGPEPRSLELELAAHGDGAHFARHTDIPIGEGREPLGAGPGEDRVLSGVFYFYREPKAFSGGCLRLFPFPGQQNESPSDRDYVDIEPVQNSLVVFPSWVAHEVRPVTCNSKQFADYRFALNCWFCRKL